MSQRPAHRSTTHPAPTMAGIAGFTAVFVDGRNSAGLLNEVYDRIEVHGEQPVWTSFVPHAGGGGVRDPTQSQK